MNIPIDKQGHALAGCNISTVVGFTTLLLWLAAESYVCGAWA